MCPAPGLPGLEDRVYLDWFKAHSHASLRRYLASSSASAADLIDYLAPFGATYHSALNPVFLAECESLLQLQFARTWLARDGIVPLAWFFSRFREPHGFKGTIYVPEEYAAVVPSAWAKRVGTYRFGELPRTELPENYTEYKLPRTKLILLGISSPAYCSVEYLRELLTQARKRFKARFGSFPREVSVCLVQKTEPLGTAEESSRHANEAMLAVCQEFGTDIQVMDLRDFETTSSFNGAVVLEVNERLLCADTALAQVAVGKGAALLGQPLESDYDRFVRTTLTHGFGIREPGKAAANNGFSRGFQKSFEQAMASRANRYFPWHHWSESEKAQLEPSALTGFPRFVRTSSLLYWATLAGGAGALDVVYGGADKLEVHGWCIDPETSRTPSEIHVYRGKKRLLGKLERFARPDVQKNFNLEFNANFKPGFVFQVPKESLERPRTEDVYSVYGMFGSGLAMLLGEFMLDPERGSAITVPRKNAEVGSYYPIKLTKAGLELATGGARSAEYALSSLSGHYQARLDLAEVVDGEIVLAGWAADLERSYSAEAIAVYGGGKHALIFPLLQRRPDIGAMLKRSEACGFNARAPWVRPRVFVLFDSHVAIEVSVPATSGSA
jgi:hypothetical protein